MSIKYFDNYKLDNTSAAIPATQYGTLDLVGVQNVTNTYTKNGLGLNGLDLSITTDSAFNGVNYAVKNNIPTLGNSQTNLGFYVDQYTYSGGFFPLTEPSVLPTNSCKNVTISNDGVYLAASSQTGSPSVYVYKRTGNTFTKLTVSVPTPPVAAPCISFNPANNTQLVVGLTSTPFIQIFLRSGDTFPTMGTVAGTAPPGALNNVTYSNDGAFLAVGFNGSPFMGLYSISGTTYTRLGNPTTLPTSSATAMAWSPDSTYLAVGNNGSAPFFCIYKRTGTTFAKLTAPTSLPASQVTGVAFSPDGNYVAVAIANSTFLIVYKRSGDVFTKLADPVYFPAGLNGAAVDFSSDGTYLSVGTTISPFLITYKRSGDTLTHVDNFSTAVTISSMQSLKYSPDNTFLYAGSAFTPFMVIFDTQINVISSISNQTDIALELDKVNNSPKLLITRRDGTIGLSLYKSDLTTVVAPSVSLSSLGLDDSMTGSYLEINVTGTVASLYVNNVLATSLSDAYLNTLITGTMRTVFRRDINTSTAATTVTTNITDVYASDDLGANTSKGGRLGPIVVDDYRPTSDVSVQWAPNSGSTNFSRVNENPPDGDTSYVSTSTDTAVDDLDITISTPYNASTVLASRLTTVAKSSGTSISTLSLVSDNIINNVGTLSTTYNGYSSPVNEFSQLSRYVAIVNGITSPYVSMFKIDKNDSMSPVTLPTIPVPAISSPHNVKFSKDGQYFGIASYIFSSPPAILKINPLTDTFDGSSISFSPTFTDHATALDFSPDGTYLAVGGQSTGIYFYKRSGDTFTRISTGTTLPGGAGTSPNDISFSPDGNYVAVVTNLSPFLNIFKRSGDTFTIITTPVMTIDGLVCKWSPNGQVLYVARFFNSGSNGGLLVYTKSPTDVVTLLTTLQIGTLCSDMSITPDNAYLFYVNNVSPYSITYQIGGTPSSPSFTPVTKPAAFQSAVAETFTQTSSDNRYVGFCVGTTGTNPFIYKRVGSTFTAVPYTLTTTGINNGIVFSPSYDIVPDVGYKYNK